MAFWRAEDDVLYERLEDESLAMRLFSLYSRSTRSIHPRAGGLVGQVRRLPGGAEAVGLAAAGDVAKLSRFIDTWPLKGSPPELLHHLALFHGSAAATLEASAPDHAATAWTRALAAWLALADERAYLVRLEAAVLGEGKRAKSSATMPERAPLELLADLGARALDAATTLGVAGTTALMALARTDEAARLAEASPVLAARVRTEARRRRNAAVETALNVIADALDDANLRGELVTEGRIALLRAVAVWTWTSHDEAVEHFAIRHLDKIGWEIYRTRQWATLRYLLDPFTPLIDSLAKRIESDPAQIAYAAGCAQMFVFMAESEPRLVTKLALAERSVKVCPSSRNGRVILASALCDEANVALRALTIMSRTEQITRIEALLERAESLYPATRELPETRGMLERAKKNIFRR